MTSKPPIPWGATYLRSPRGRRSSSHQSRRVPWPAKDTADMATLAISPRSRPLHRSEAIAVLNSGRTRYTHPVRKVRERSFGAASHRKLRGAGRAPAMTVPAFSSVWRRGLGFRR